MRRRWQTRKRSACAIPNGCACSAWKMFQSQPIRCCRPLPLRLIFSLQLRAGSRWSTEFLFGRIVGATAPLSRTNWFTLRNINASAGYYRSSKPIFTNALLLVIAMRHWKGKRPRSQPDFVRLIGKLLEIRGALTRAKRLALALTFYGGRPFRPALCADLRD